MSFYNLKVQDSLVLRDNRFGQGSIMRSLEWVSPSVMSGSARTAIGKVQTPKGQIVRWNHEALRSISVAGPFPVKDGCIGFFPPADVVAQGEKESSIFHVYPLQPRNVDDDAGVDLPEGLLPCFLPDEAVKGKPTSLNGFWSLERMKKWLLGCGAFSVDSAEKLVDWSMPVVDQSVHVKIKPDTLSSEDGMLFTCSSLSFMGPSYDLSVRIQSDDLPQRGIHPVGGERHLVQWNKTVAPAGWECPVEIKSALADGKYVRMVLASPAIFKKGWLPDWIDERTLQGIVPGTNVKVILKSAVLQRWKAISGWSYELKGPKPIRRMVPTGSVYFFEIIEGDAAGLSEMWMKSVCGKTQNINDGFGLVLWGIWNI